MRVCSVPGCKSTYGKDESLRFHRFPKDKKRKDMWCAKIRMGKKPSETTVVCSNHFTPTDYRLNILQDGSSRTCLKFGSVPSQNLPKPPVSTVSNSEKDSTRQPGSEEKEKTKSRADFASVLCFVELSTPDDAKPIVKEDKPDDLASCSEDCSLSSDAEDMCQDDDLPSMQDAGVAQHSIQTASDVLPTMEEAALILKRNTQKTTTTTTEDKQVQCNTLAEHVCRVDPLTVLSTDEKVSALTGIPTKHLFDTLCQLYRREYKTFSKYNMLCVESKILLTFMKLKLGISYTALAALFCIGQSTAGSIFKLEISRLAQILGKAVCWLPKETVVENMPRCFNKYKNTRVILDCKEFPVERPTCLKCRAATYSHYKLEHTCKVLIGVAPSGVISFISKAYGGAATDKHITEECGVLNKCIPFVDAVMVKKGFLIDELCGEKGIQLMRPPTEPHKVPISKARGLASPCVAAARIHVDRAVGRLKGFTIFKQKLPFGMLNQIDEVLLVCAAIVNLSRPILSDDKFT